MKKRPHKLSIDKFTVSKLKNPDKIIGGNGDDGTDSGDTSKRVCVAKSAVYVDRRKQNSLY